MTLPEIRSLSIDRDRFFTRFRDEFGPLSQPQVDGLNELLTFFEIDPHLTDARWAAYMLATVKHECANTWHPIEEIGRGKGKSYGVADSQGRKYYGRGYVQLTWKRNYRVMGNALGLPLGANPDEALQPDNAYWIMSHGMRHGLFTGARLSQFISGQKCDYYQARRIINGLDKAPLIEGYAEAFEYCLKAVKDTTYFYGQGWNE